MLGLFSGELIFGGAYYWKEFCVSKWVGLDNKNSLKQLKTASTNSPWAYIREGLLSEGFLCLRFGGLIFGRAYFFFLGGGGAYYRNFTVHEVGKVYLYGGGTGWEPRSKEPGSLQEAGAEVRIERNKRKFCKIYWIIMLQQKKHRVGATSERMGIGSTRYGKLRLPPPPPLPSHIFSLFWCWLCWFQRLCVKNVPRNSTSE